MNLFIANWKGTQSAIGNWNLAILPRVSNRTGSASDRPCRFGAGMLGPALALGVLLGALTIGDRIAIAEGESNDKDVVMRAMVDELDRSGKELVLSDLSRPYFIQLNTQDRQLYTQSAAYGGLQRSNQTHNRMIGVRIRVGSFGLDNTNFRRGYGQVGALPLDDDYAALRHGIWLLLDQDYKQAVETFTQKLAYLKDKTAEDRPDDFSAASTVTVVEPMGTIDFDAKAWEANLQRLSERFKHHPKIQDSNVTLFAGGVTEWIVNTEGTRLRMGDSGIQIQINAELQADDGMPLADTRTYLGERVDQLPPIDKMLADIDEMSTKLVELAGAARLEQYTGPILFEALAAANLFEALLSDSLCARPTPLGSGAEDNSLEKKIGLRILPRTFHVFDDPGPRIFENTVLAGAYRFDDEAVAATRVELVEKGILKTLVAGRAPTKKIKQSTGHGRSPGLGDPQATIGNQYISADDALSAEELKQELIQTARDEGLEFGLRVASIEEGQAGALGNPIHAYKVSVADGHEEPVRGMQFRPIETRSLKRILAAGKERRAYNSVSGTSSSIIAPALLFEELELTKVEGEFDKLPILQSPATRKETP